MLTHLVWGGAWAGAEVSPLCGHSGGPLGCTDQRPPAPRETRTPNAPTAGTQTRTLATLLASHSPGHLRLPGP